MTEDRLVQIPGILEWLYAIVLRLEDTDLEVSEESSVRLYAVTNTLAWVTGENIELPIDLYERS